MLVITPYLADNTTMRINKFIAMSTGLSRRAADRAIADGLVHINGQVPSIGHEVTPSDQVTFKGQAVRPLQVQTILLNKPAGYVTSRDGQGSVSVYDLLPPALHHLKPVGRLDKHTSGVLLLTNDGDLAQTLTHPSRQKVKVYEVTLDKPLAPLHHQMIHDFGVQLEDGRSQLGLERLIEGNDKQWRVIMHEGRNRQIRRTFESLGYRVVKLHRTQFGPYSLQGTASGKYRNLAPSNEQ